MLLQLVVVIEVTGKEPSWHKMTMGDEPLEKFADRVRDTVVHLEASAEGAESVWNCPAQSNECAIRRKCTNKCGALDPPAEPLDLGRVKRLVAEFDAGKVSALALVGTVPPLIKEIERLRALALDDLAQLTQDMGGYP